MINKIDLLLLLNVIQSEIIFKNRPWCRPWSPAYLKRTAGVCVGCLRGVYCVKVVCGGAMAWNKIKKIIIFSIKFLIQNRVIYQTLKPIIPIWVIEKNFFFTDS